MQQETQDLNIVSDSEPSDHKPRQYSEPAKEGDKQVTDVKKKSIESGKEQRPSMLGLVEQP